MSRIASNFLRFCSLAGTAVFAAVMAANWTALLLAEFSRFNAWGSLAAGGVAGALVWWLASRNRIPTEQPGPAWPVAAAILLAMASLLLTTPPSEMILGGWDPGVYLHTAAGVARQHTLQLAVPDLIHLHPQEGPLIARDLHGIPELFGGMRLLPTGRITPQFHHAYPTLLAVVWSLAGLKSVLMVNPLLNIGCLLAFFALVRRLLGAQWALVALVLLAVNPGQIWQARFSTAETLGQFYLLGAITLWLPHHSGRVQTRLELVLTGAALGLALMTRYDVILLAAPMLVLLFFSLADFPGRRQAVIMMSVFGALLLHAWWHQKVIAPYYSPLHQQLFPCLIGAAALAGVWVILRRFPRVDAMADWLKRHDAGLRLALCLAFVGWVLFAWIVRPALDTSRLDARIIRKVLSVLGQQELHEFLAGRESANIRYLASLFTPLGLGLGLAGVACMIRQWSDARGRVWLYSAVAVLMVLTTSVFHDHFMMWVSRRYIPVVVPLITLGGVVGAAWVWNRLRIRGAWIAAAAVLVYVAIPPLWNLPATAAIARTRDWPGLVQWFQPLRAALPRRALIYCDQPGFAAALRFIYGRAAYELHFPKPEKYKQLTGILGDKVRQGALIFYLSENAPVPVDDVHYRKVAEFPLRSSILSHSRSSIPREVKPRGADFVLYRVVLESDP